jgi:Na+/melibiose symporter-like transporter
VTGWNAVLDAFGLLVRPDGSNAAAVGLSLFFVLGSLVQIVGIACSKPLADRFGKKVVFITGASVTTVATALVFFAGPTQVGLMFWLSILWAAGWGPTVTLPHLMMADVADHSEWLTHRRATGFMFAGASFALKAGLSLGGALSAWLIDAYGYVPNVAQTEAALLGIRLGASLYPALMLALGIVSLAFFPIGKTLNLRIQKELAERRQEYATEAGAAAS